MIDFLFGSTGLVHKYSHMQQTAVVMFPTPSELKSRAAKRFNEMGKEIPAEAVNEMTGTWTYTHYHFTLKVTCSLSSSFFFSHYLYIHYFTSYLKLSLSANFVLPLSKDMPHSKEPFDEVYSNVDIIVHLLTSVK